MDRFRRTIKCLQPIRDGRNLIICVGDVAWPFEKKSEADPVSSHLSQVYVSPNSPSNPTTIRYAATISESHLKISLCRGGGSENFFVVRLEKVKKLADAGSTPPAGAARR